jgi:hypothetical protein
MRLMAAVVPAFVVMVAACAPRLPDDLPGLMDAMATYDMQARWYACEKVRRVYGKEGFLRALHHRSEYTRGAAAHWLGNNYAGSDVEDALMSVASDDDDHVRMWVAWSLGELGSRRVAVVLTRLEADRTEIVRRHAAEAMEKLRKRELTLGKSDTGPVAGAAQPEDAAADAHKEGVQ